MIEQPFYLREMMNIPELKGLYKVLDLKTTKLAFSWLEENFQLPWGQIDWSRVDESNSIKINYWSNDQIGEYLLSLSLPEINASWSIIWSDFDLGITMPFIQVCKFIENIWYPAKSNVWIISPNKDCCVEITHESFLSHALLK